MNDLARHVSPAGIDDGPECCLVAVELSKKSRLPGSRMALPDKIVLHDLPAGDSVGASAFLGLGTGVARTLGRPLTPGLEAECDAIASGQVKDHPHADRIVGLTAFKGIGTLPAGVG